MDNTTLIRIVAGVLFVIAVPGSSNRGCGDLQLLC